MKKISPLGIILGILAAQVSSYALASSFAILCMLIYGNKVLVALLEYPSSIAVTLIIGVISAATGGFVAVSIAKKSLINALICGAFTLCISLAFLYAVDFKYANHYTWMLVLGLLLITPSAYLGGYIFMATHNNEIQSAQEHKR